MIQSVTSLVLALAAAAAVATLLLRGPRTFESAALEDAVSALLPKLARADGQALIRELRAYERASRAIRRRAGATRIDRAYDARMRVLRLIDHATVSLSAQGPHHWRSARIAKRAIEQQFQQDAARAHDAFGAHARADLRADPRRFDPQFDAGAVEPWASF